MRTALNLVATLCLLGAFSAKADEFVTTYAPPGAQWPGDIVKTNATLIGTETFDGMSSASAGKNGFTTDYGTKGVTGVYSSGVEIYQPGMFGGAGGTGQYAAALHNYPGYMITLKLNGVPGVNYFGFWLSALDPANMLTFYRAGVKIGGYDPGKMMAALGECPSPPPWARGLLPVKIPSQISRYCSNPNSGKDPWELYAFVAFVDLDGYFDEIRFAEAADYPGNFETDNHTVAYCGDPRSCISGGAIALARRHFAQATP